MLLLNRGRISLLSKTGNPHRRKESPVVDLAAGAAPRVLPELLDDRLEDGLGREKAGSPQSPLHAGLGDVSRVEVVVVHEEGGETKALCVNLVHGEVQTKS